VKRGKHLALSIDLGLLRRVRLEKNFLRPQKIKTPQIKIQPSRKPSKMKKLTPEKKNNNDPTLPFFRRNLTPTKSSKILGGNFNFGPSGPNLKRPPLYRNKGWGDPSTSLTS